MPILTQKIKSRSPQPARTIVLSFLGVILIGTILLMMPFSSQKFRFTPLIDCLFTATSATCVTGLVVYDTYTHWSPLGQGIILAMIQIGGLGLVTFTSFFNFAIGRKLGLRSMQLASESVNSTWSGFGDVRKLVSSIIKTSVCFELAGALLLMISFIPRYGVKGIWISVFLAISAFCNAGFDILGMEGPYSSLIHYTQDPVVMGTIMLLIICGGLGFIVWRDLYQYRTTKKLLLHTKVVLSATAILIVTGALLMLLLEWDNPATLGECSVPQKFVHALFQSITFRTAGFNTIDPAQMHSLTKICAILIMFIGAAPGSTGGGIKVTTFMVVVMTVVCVTKNHRDTIIMHRKIDKDVVYKSLSIIVLAALVVAITSCILVFTNAPLVEGIDSVFESVSAFATVGISSGPTAVANHFSRILLALTMFIGRVGPVSTALSLTLRHANSPKNEIIPEGKIIVG